MKSVAFPALFALVFSTALTAQEQGTLDASPTLFAVMSAINAAGYTVDINSPNSPALRAQVRDEILRVNPPSLAAIRDFFEKHKKPTNTEELSQYVSFGLSVAGPPDFRFKIRDLEVPPDALALKEFAPLLAKFYKEADIPSLWKRSQTAINRYLERYHEPLINALTGVNGYLRQTPSGLRGRNFQIYVELLAAPGQAQTRSYGYDYTIVVAPSAEPRIFDIRHAYLHYLLDPLTLQQREILQRKQVLADHTQRAPGLDKSFKNDFILLASECLIKAVEARLDRKPAAVQDALKQGYILTPFFSEQLKPYEAQEASMALFFPEMAKAIDLRTEEARLIKVQFDSAPPPAPKIDAPPAPPAPTGAAKTLADADDAYSKRNTDPANLEKAKGLYQAALQQDGDSQLQAAATYGLACIATLQNDPETAEGLFKKVLELGPTPQIRAWALVYLGRLSLAADERDQAVKYFEEALKVDGASDAARRAASDGLQNNRNK